MTLPGYGKLYRLGKKETAGILREPVVVQEKVDGSQFSFGLGPEGEVLCRSKGRQLPPDDANFALAIRTVEEAAPSLCHGYVYRAEYVSRQKHNVLTYGRVPRGHLALFEVDVTTYGKASRRDSACPKGGYLGDLLGVEEVPILFEGEVRCIDDLNALLTKPSFLGGQMEGVVIKSLSLRDRDGYPLRAKYVSEAFQEVARKPRTPRVQGTDFVDAVARKYTSEARFHKAVQALRDDGKLSGSMRDIGAVIWHMQKDLAEEEADSIRDDLFKSCWRDIAKKTTKDVAKWYEALLEDQE